MRIIETGNPRRAEFVCSWCGTVWEADTTEKGVYNYNMIGRSYPRMKCPLCAEKYVVGNFISCEDDEKA